MRDSLLDRELVLAAVTSGITEGLVLSSLSIIIYVNDIPYGIFSMITKYATVSIGHFSCRHKNVYRRIVGWLIDQIFV